MSKGKVHQLGLGSYLLKNVSPVPFTSRQSFYLPHSVKIMSQLVPATARHEKKPFHRLKRRFKAPKMTVACLAHPSPIFWQLQPNPMPLVWPLVASGLLLVR